MTLAAVPLVGAAWFGLNEVAQVTQSRRQAQTVADSAEEYLQLIELRARLLDESNWFSAEIGVTDIGVDVAYVEVLTGIDVVGERRDAEAAVDALLLALDWPDTASLVEQIRLEEEPVLDDISVAYETIADDVESWADVSFDELLNIAGDISSGSDLVVTVRVLEGSAAARSLVTLQLTSYFASQFGGLETSSASLGELTEERSEYLEAVADVARVAGRETEVYGALQELEASDDVLIFRDAIATLLATPPPAATTDGIDIGAVFAQLDALTTTFQAATGSIDAHLRLVDAAVSDVAASVQTLDDSAAADSRRAVIWVSTLVAASVLFAMGLARAIQRPLGQLAKRARDLRDGDGMSLLKPSGPTEIREVMHAINEASAHLELAERQAQALARGELHSPVLSESAPGALGQSLQETVKTLASSLNQGEEFRQKLEHEATHDGLTRLANRKATLAHLRRGLSRTRRTGGTLAILFLDLDGFKEINDHYGHPVGDEVLCAVSERLTSSVRDGDLVGRIGGDEFVIIAEPVAGAAEAVLLAERVVEAVGRPVSVASTTLDVSVSIGIALADQNSLMSAGDLLHEADLAVYKAKGMGRSKIELCDDDLRDELAQRSLIEEAVGNALVRDEFTLHYQPIVGARTGELMSLEALIRWERPDHGLTAPDVFLPTAELSDLILDIDRAVADKVVEQLAAWTTDDTMAQVPIAMNVSGRHLNSDAFVSDILAPIRRRGIDPGRLVLELTEGSLLHDLSAAAQKLQLLRDQGIRIAIDDFGTGFTSIAQLRTLPVDILKIDRTFTADETASSLVRLIVDAGHLLGARVISEGIETIEQANRLTDLGSDDLQGYYFGHPMPPAELLRHRSKMRLATAALAEGAAAAT